MEDNKSKKIDINAGVESFGMDRCPRYYTAAELSDMGKDAIPEELVSGKHLIYSSPATLAFNSPGAQGFGVKRAGLAIPGSVMLLVAPGCCGRNTTILSELPEYEDRFFYLMMDETDIVTGRHLKKIPQAVREVVEGLKDRPSLVMICITCVDALLGTDMERMCRKAERECGLPVRPCYMYALTREGRRPPMVHVRQSIYSLLEKTRRKRSAVNILGYFAPLEDDCELYEILQAMGVTRIREISRCRTFEEYQEMAQANFSLVLNPEARAAADDMTKKLGIPFVELARLYRLDKIRRQYTLFGAALGETVDDQAWYDQAKAAIKDFRDSYPDTVFSIGEGCNANAFELALALLEYGFAVREIFKDPFPDDYRYIDQIAALSPGTRIYSNLEPTMLYYDIDDIECVDSDRDPLPGSGEAPDANNTGRGSHLVIGKDAVYYHPQAACLEWSQDIQPFGYRGLIHFFKECGRVLEDYNAGAGSPEDHIEDKEGGNAL